jgi:hypothetical protein
MAAPGRLGRLFAFLRNRQHGKAAAPARRRPLGALIALTVRHADRLAWPLLALGLLGLLVLPLDERRVKFDEKSLMVGSATATFSAAAVRCGKRYGGGARSSSDIDTHSAAPEGGHL